MNPDTEELLGGLLNFVSLAENERRLLAAEIHDQLLCDLRGLSDVARRLQDIAEASSNPDSFREGLDRILRGLDAAVNETRRIMEHLQPSVLDSFGLISALEACLRQVAQNCEPKLEPHMRVQVKEEELGLSQEEQLSVYRMVQEALTNTCRHARAESVDLRIFLEDCTLVVRIADDGNGLENSTSNKGTRGMDNMRFRAQLIGAQIQWSRNDPKGTLVEIRIPRKG